MTESPALDEPTSGHITVSREESVRVTEPVNMNKNALNLLRQVLQRAPATFEAPMRASGRARRRPRRSPRRSRQRSRQLSSSFKPAPALAKKPRGAEAKRQGEAR